MPKSLTKPIMVRSKLRKTKKDYFDNLNVKGLSVNKHFWKTIKLHLVAKDWIQTICNMS